MVQYWIGNMGHLSVITAFVFSLLATFSYYKFSVATDQLKRNKWLQNARIAYYVHVFSVMAIIFSLYYIISSHRYEYHYAYAHSSLTLPFYYMISSFWEGQEGSFLLWMFWNTLLGLAIIFSAKKWEGPVMTVFSLVQAFLTSMILGVVIFNLKIGSSPFTLLRDALEAPIFEVNPDYIPEDGQGLNPLLQNYWMVIHPPTLFLGYATTLVPFAFLIAGLWKKEFKSWIKPALPWTIFSIAVLGVGQLMGAYWAYETLSFGGYWSWDPVENAVYVPWIIQVASLHTMIIYKNNGSALKTSMVLVIATFILILYATFLTRSGILGNASVHSFTDLGLSGQLLIYLLAFLIIAILFLVARWKQIPVTQKEVNTYSREFWIFLGATTLCLMGFQVMYGTSIPVFNKIIEVFGGTSNIAPPTDAIGYYTKFQIWGAVLIALLSGTGQFFWWKKMDRSKLKEALLAPVIITLLITAIIIVFANIHTVSYIILLLAAVYTIVANFFILIRLQSKKVHLAGGAIAHMGVGLMLIGILFSSGYSKVISLNRSGLLYSKEMSDEMNRENVLLFVDEPREMNEYELVYKGRRKEVKGISGFFPEKDLEMINVQEAVVTGKIEEAGFEIGDTVTIHQPENTYYEVHYRRDGETAFVLFPRAQVNPSMGLVVSPDIKRTVKRDLYTHISTIPDPESDVEWSEPEMHTLKIGERFFVNDHVAVLKDIVRVPKLDGILLDDDDVAVKATISIFGKEEDYQAEPIFIVKNKQVGNIPSTMADIGVKISFTNVYPDDNTFELTTRTTQKDYIIMKAVEKPFINLLWVGTIILTIGFFIATKRRFSDYRKEADKS
jgi:cytochrome c-type biogenesis protein CcmF